MLLENLEAYWKVWVLQEAQGHPFSFLTGSEEEEQEGQGGSQDEEQGDQENEQEDQENEQEDSAENQPPIPPTPEFNIDNGIPLPCQCDTPDLRTFCLQQLVPKFGATGKTFHVVVGLVNDLLVIRCDIVEAPALAVDIPFVSHLAFSFLS